MSENGISQGVTKYFKNYFETHIPLVTDITINGGSEEMLPIEFRVSQSGWYSVALSGPISDHPVTIKVNDKILPDQHMWLNAGGNLTFSARCNREAKICTGGTTDRKQFYIYQSNYGKRNLLLTYVSTVDCIDLSCKLKCSSSGECYINIKLLSL